MSALVSVVIPCYNGARYLADAIESCLRQTYRHIEVIVVDDASPDDCAGIADGIARRDPRVRVIRRLKNGRVSRAFNTGFDAAKGEYFTRLAQDDLFQESALESLVHHLEAHPHCGLVYADQQIIDEAGVPIKLEVVKEPEEALRNGNAMGLCVMWRRTVWQAIGKFDPAFDTAEDYEYWLRISKRFKIEKVSGEALLCFRQHAQMGTNRFAAKQGFAIRLAKAMHLGTSREAVAEVFWDEYWRLLNEKDYKPAWKCLYRCIRYCPTRLVYWKAAAGAIFKLA